ncbi:hypothetical protein CSUI_003397, partial [Cystoisospora suis]
STEAGLCFFCRSPEHNLVGFQWWQDYIGADATKRSACPKCLQQGHSYFSCPEASGVMWGHGPGPSIPGKQKSAQQAVAAAVMAETPPVVSKNTNLY